MNSTYKLTPEQRQEIVTKYHAGRSSGDLSKEYGVSAANVWALLKRRGIETRDRRTCKLKYKVNDDAFDAIDTEEKAYWLGFLAADGCLYEPRLSVSLGLSIKDKSHLRRFAAFLNSGHALTVNNVVSSFGESQIVGWGIRNPRLYSSLEKAFSAIWAGSISTVVPIDLERHFWRGVIDGDGCVTYAATIGQCKRWRILLTSDKELCHGFLEFVQNHLPTRARVRPHKSIYSVEFCGVGLPRAIAALLYQDSAVSLIRKADVARNIMQARSASTKWNDRFSKS